MTRILTGILLTMSTGLMVLGGCDKPAAEPSKGSSTTTTKGDGHDHGKGDGHEHSQGDGHSHGPVTQLGEQVSGTMKVSASRDGGIKAGGDAPIDVWVTGNAKPVVAVRFWIGKQDAQGSMKAKADIENPKDPTHWHTHAEIPDPLGADAKLWVEIELEGGAKSVVSFDLKV